MRQNEAATSGCRNPQDVLSWPTTTTGEAVLASVLISSEILLKSHQKSVQMAEQVSAEAMVAVWGGTSYFTSSDETGLHQPCYYCYL